MSMSLRVPDETLGASGSEDQSPCIHTEDNLILPRSNLAHPTNSNYMASSDKIET